MVDAAFAAAALAFAMHSFATAAKGKRLGNTEAKQCATAARRSRAKGYRRAVHLPMRAAADTLNGRGIAAASGYR